MKKTYTICLFSAFLIISSCATQKKRDDISWLSKQYHNMTAKYNGYFNANEIMDDAFVSLDETYEDNFNKIIEVYPYAEIDPSDNVISELDIAIEKVTKVSRLHEPSKWLDDCYVLMGKAQYLQGNYEAAAETLEYFVKNFNPRDPESRIYQGKKISGKSKAKKQQKEAEKERKKQIAEREKLAKEQEKERKKKNKERKKKKPSKKDKKKSVDDQRKSTVENREKTAEELKKEREEEKKRINKERQQKIKDRKKGSKKKKSDNKKEEVKPPNKIEEKPKTASEPTPQKEIPTEKKKAETDEKKKEEDTQKEVKAKKAQIEKEMEKNSGKGGFLKHHPAYYEGMLWLSKTYVSLENYISANYYLNRIEEEHENVPNKILDEVHAVRSFLHLKQKKYKDAIPSLQRAAEVSQDKNSKARYNFILAQIYQNNGETTKASDAFNEVKRHGKDYHMVLNAKLNQIRNSWSNKTTTYNKAINQLDRMLKENKNANYSSPIYFAKAEINLAAGNTVDALEDFQSALSGDVSSINKQESYYRLATLYLGLEDYVKAQYYFDSTAAIMNSKDDRYSSIIRSKNDLTEIAKYITEIEELDSLLKLSKMSNEDLNALALESIKQDQRLADLELTQPGAKIPPAKTAYGNSNFFAFNLRAIERGKREFRKVWGNVNLEDNWRVSSKASITINDETETGNNQQSNNSTTQDKIDEFLKNIPKTKNKKKQLNEQRDKAYFNLGIGFRNYLDNYEKSNHWLETYITEFPQGNNLLDAYYYLHLNYKDLGNSTKANEYYQLILNQYGDSDYAKVLQNPSYALEIMTASKKIQKTYDEAFQLFENGQFQQSYDLLESIKESVEIKDPIAPKYELLKAMCIGNLKGKSEYVKSLRIMTIRFPDSEEQVKAKEILRFLSGDLETFDGEVENEELVRFQFEPDKKHYVVIAIHESNDNEINDIRAALNDYNQENHKSRKLRSTSIYLGGKYKTQLVLLRLFNNKNEVMTYYSDLAQSIIGIIDPNQFNYSLFAVSQRNYREIIKQKTVRNYRTYFEAHYFD